MQNFDSLKNMWQESSANEVKLPAAVDISNKSNTTKMKLQKTQLYGIVMLMLTAIFIASLAVFGNLNFKYWYTYGAMVLICAVCLTQAAFMFATYKKIKRIDDMVAPAAHLQQWEAYYALRKKQNRWNMPLYYILLNIAMGIYVIEIFAGRPVVNVMIFIAVYIAWMLFAYFYLGRKNIKRENNRLQKIIDELRTIEGQLVQPE